MYPATADAFSLVSDKWKSKIDYLIGKGMVTDISDTDTIVENIAKSFASKADKRGTNTRCKLMGLQIFLFSSTFV